MSTGHLRTHRDGKTELVHRIVVEDILGRRLPKDAVVHHINEDRADNRPQNLVVCENDAYHKLLHRRMRALAATGDANKRQCAYCREWDDREAMTDWTASRNRSYHKSCAANYQYVRRHGHPKGAR